MTTIRSVRSAEGKFVQVSNTAARDRRLSLRARGVLLFVLSLPPDQHFTAKWLESKVPEGREAVRAALRELEACGYFRRQRKHGSDGRWAWEQVISDAPLEVAEEDAAPDDGNPSDGEPSNGKPSDKRSNTAPANTNELKEASRRARTSASAKNRTVAEVVRDVRSAVAEVHSQREADGLDNDDALGLYFRYAHRAGVHNLVPYLRNIFESAPYLESFLANSEPVCCECVRPYDDCECQAA